MWQFNMKLAKKKEIAAKFAKHTHTSTKIAISQMPYLQAMFGRKVDVGIVENLELSSDEVEWLRK
jgi:hypothetical protein